MLSPHHEAMPVQIWNNAGTILNKQTKILKQFQSHRKTCKTQYILCQKYPQVQACKTWCRSLNFSENKSICMHRHMHAHTPTSHTPKGQRVPCYQSPEQLQPIRTSHIYNVVSSFSHPEHHIYVYNIVSTFGQSEHHKQNIVSSFSQSEHPI